MRALLKKLQSRNPKVVDLALTLFDTLLKNGGRAVHSTAGAKEIQTAMKELCEGRTGSEVQVRQPRTLTCRPSSISQSNQVKHFGTISI